MHFGHEKTGLREQPGFPVFEKERFAYSATALSTLTLTPGPMVELSETFFM